VEASPVYEIPEYKENATRRSSVAMDQRSIKIPNNKCRLFLKIYQKMYLAAGVEYMYPCTGTYRYLFTQGRGRGR
jgi:hypothetical protein